MKFFYILILMFTSCVSTHSVYIHNNTNHLILFDTYPSFESLYFKGLSYYDTILTHRTIQNNNTYYFVNPNEKFRLFSGKGRNISIKQFPFTHLLIINDRDTVNFKSKQEIIDSTKKFNSTYFIEIK
jgi:hypothetical protein